MRTETLDENFKKEIVQMIIEQNVTVAQVAKEKHININTLYSWKKNMD